ncbi:protein A40 [Elysia marginata]|uniref:Protein A40 n=1 Tax=Elysia marginata TaxID=1093978 RepID=A0AAV4JFU7_9GAST|nr:protein A40 [Elysia marginata]
MCVLEASLKTCGIEYRQLISRIWPISLGSHKARGRKWCWHFQLQGSRCPAGWKVNTRTYVCLKMSTERKSWMDARRACGHSDADLVKVVDPNFLDFIRCENIARK